MINLKVGKHKCSIPNKWNEMNVSEYAKIVKILSDFDIKKIEDLEDEHEKEQQKLINIKANRDVFKFLSGLEDDVIQQCNLTQMNQCLDLMNQFLNSEVDKGIIEENKQQSFKWKNKKYLFPFPNMKESTFGDYIEAEQVTINAHEMEGGRFGLIARQMAILCKEEGEKTNDDLIEKKTRLFEKLPMDIVWKFVFFLSKQIKICKPNIRTSSKTETELKTDTHNNIGK